MISDTNMRKICNPFIIFLLSVLVVAFKGDSGNVSLHMELKKLLNGKVLITKADVYYNIDGNIRFIILTLRIIYL